MSLTGWENITNGNLWKGLKSTFSQIGEGLYNFGNKIWKDYTGQTSNEKNLEFQRENLDYQKAIQQEIFQREDSAYQRTTADMRAAGLNPISMQGTNGSGEAVATNAPESQRTSDLQAIGQIMNVMSQLNVNRNNNSVSQANANLINAQADNQKIKNIYESDILNKTLEGLDFSNTGKRFENERKNIAWLNDIKNYAFNEQFGISDNMPDFAKMINYATHQGSLSKDWSESFRRTWDNNSFGNTFNYHDKNPDFSNIESLLNKSNLKGALQENALANALLKLIGIN